MQKVRVLLADDQQEILEAVSRLVDGEFSVVAVVKDGQQAIEAAARLDPDLLVLDISMPILTGIEAATRLRQSGSRANVIFLTVYSYPDYVEAAFSAGGLGYVLKSRLALDLIPAMREVSRGRTFVSPPLNARS